MKIDATTLIELFKHHDPSDDLACHLQANEDGHILVVDQFDKAMAELNLAHAARCAAEAAKGSDLDIRSKDMQNCYGLVNAAAHQFASLLNEVLPEDVNRTSILEHVHLASMWMNLWMASIASRKPLEAPFKAKVRGHLQEALMLTNLELCTAHAWRSLPAAGTQPTVTPERKKGYLEDLDDRLEPDGPVAAHSKLYREALADGLHMARTRGMEGVPEMLKGYGLVGAAVVQAQHDIGSKLKAEQEPELVEDRDLIDPKATGGSQNPLTQILALTARVAKLEQGPASAPPPDERVATLATSLDVWKGRVEELENQLGGLRTEFVALQSLWLYMGAGNPIGEDGEPMMGFIQPNLTDEQAEAFSQAEREERAMAVAEAQEARRAAEKEQAAQEAMRLDLESRKPPEKEEPADPRLRGKTPPPPPRLDPSKVPSMPEIWVTDEARKP